MEIDHVNAIRPQGPRYAPPHRRPMHPARNESAKPPLSMDKATRFRGAPLNEDLKHRYGDTCHYCKQTGHWCNNCKAYWEDVKQNIINPPPHDFNSPQSNYLPPSRPQNHRLRQVDVPEVSDGKVLLDSGASTHVSGSLQYFSDTTTMKHPRTIRLAVADCKIDVRYTGTVKLQTTKGTLMINNVLYCLGVDGVILSIGQLTKKGWSVNFRQNHADFIAPDNTVYDTLYKNYCWFLRLSSEEINVNKVTQKPSFDSFLWH